MGRAEAAFLHNRRRNSELVLLLASSAIALLCFSSLSLASEGRLSGRWFVLPLGLMGIFLLLHLMMRLLLPRADHLVLPLVSILCSLGLAMLYRLDPHLARLQFVWICLGSAVLALLAALLRRPAALQDFKYVIALAGLLLLFSTFFLGQSAYGARLWIRIGPFNFQPSELAKILLVIFFAAYLADKRELLTQAGRRWGRLEIPHLKHLGPLLVLWGLSLLLLIFQRDLGSSLLFFGIFLALLYVATSRFSFVVIGLLLFVLGATCCYFAFSHVQRRVKIWADPLNPATITADSYQPAQSLFAIASGGIAGTSLGRGQPGYIDPNFVTDRHSVQFVATDFIFAAFCEELGLLGGASVLLFFLLLAWRGLRNAQDCGGSFEGLLSVGLSTILFLQCFVIVGGVTRLIPLTGITLPYVSYGGSSILTNFLLAGLLLVISGRQYMEGVSRSG